MNDQMPANNGANETPPEIEGFRILENLGHGATSSVWKAEQISLNRLVVIKVLSEPLTHEPEDVTLFKAEARLAANFKHANIVQVYDFGRSQTDRRYYFVMEYISGYSVGDWIRRKGKIAEAEALVIAQVVADALKYAWDLSRIVHCDVKPDNIMVDGDGSIKVADLGLAHTVKSMTSQPGAEASEVIITGTPNYMAPEQVRGLDPIDCRTDIYALGASLYHMVTGQLPFGDSPPDVVLERQLQEDFEYPQTVNPDLSVSVTRLILKMTAKEPAERFQTWDEVLAEVIRLERQMRQQAAASTQPAPAADAAQKDALAGGDRKCRHCGQPVQSEALYCGFCGKSLAVTAKVPVEDQKKVTIRLKPIQENSTASAKPVTARLKQAQPNPLANEPVATAPTPRLRSTPRHWYTSWVVYVRVALSLCLLAFLGYYTYQKLRYNKNVIVPIKEGIIRDVQPALVKSRQYVATSPSLQKGAQVGRRFIGIKSASADQPAVAPKEISAPPETSVLPESSEPESEEEPEIMPDSEPLPPPAGAPEATAPAVSAKPEAPTQAEAPPEASESPQPPPDAAPANSSQDMGYERILQKCKQQEPKVGDRIILRFRNGRAPVEGVLEQRTDEGVTVKVPAGVIAYPFRLLTEETRLMYFPEERARLMQGQ